MNEDHFRSAATDMEDTALWDVRRIALLAARRDDATPVRYFEDAVTEALRSLHRVTQESLWDELQKHELGKRTLRALAAEYKPARMVAFEADDLRRASVRFWEALQTEDEALRDALAAYDYEAACGLLSKLSATLEREVVGRLVYINCPRANVLEEVVGTIQRCTTNELKMLASKLYDRLDRTGTLTSDNKEFAKKLPYCKTKEELRVAIRDLLQMFKRKPPPGEADPSSHLIGPSVATVTVSYQGQNGKVAAVVRIERLDKVPDDEPMVELPATPPPPEPERPPSPAHSVVTVNSDRTVPPSNLGHKRATDQEGGQPAASAPPSKAPSAKPTPPASVIGVTTPGSDIRSPKPAASPKATPLGSVLGGGGGGVKSDLGSVRGSHTSAKPSPAPSVHGGGAASDVGSVRAPSAVSSSHVGKVGVKGPGSDVGSSKSGPTHKTTPAGSVLGGPAAAPGSEVGSTRSAVRSHKTTPAGSVYGGAASASVRGSVPASVPGSAVGGAAAVKGSVPASVKSMTSEASSHSSLARDARESGANSSSQRGNSISFDHPDLPPPRPEQQQPPSPKLYKAEVEEDRRADSEGERGGSERSSSPTSSASSRSSRQQLRAPSITSSRNSLPARADSVASSRRGYGS